jgi:hypothetical protein
MIPFLDEVGFGSPSRLCTIFKHQEGRLCQTIETVRGD